MEIRFTLPDTAEQLLLRLATCIRQHTDQQPSVHDIVRSLVMEVLIDDAEQHGIVSHSPQFTQ
jgi:hypothetical protein